MTGFGSVEVEGFGTISGNCTVAFEEEETFTGLFSILLFAEDDDDTVIERVIGGFKRLLLVATDRCVV